MKYNYQFSSIIGSSYQNGNICFTPDSSTILSPVGNNVSLLNIKNDEIKTIEVNSSYNIEFIAVSPTQPIMLCINEEGFANVVSMITGHVVNHHYFRQKVNCVSFSPNGKMFAIGRGKLVMVYDAPSIDMPLTQFRLRRTFPGADADVTSIDWTSDSKAFVVGSMDKSTRVYAAFKTKKLVIYSLSETGDQVVKCAFMRDSLDVLSVTKDAQLRYWKCNKSLAFLSAEDDEALEEPNNKKSKNVITYLKSQSHFYRNIESDKKVQVEVTVADFHSQTNLLATAFVDGKIMIHEMPEFIPRYYLQGCSGEINTMLFNPIGSWIAIGSQANNELNIFCWKSQSYIFQSKGHKRSAINSLDYSPDGNCLVTGGHDGHVKLWQVDNGRCIATFTSHSGPVTGVCFPKKKIQTIFSSSLDGTVRGYDLGRLKNFCVLSAEEKSYQMTCVTTDDNGEMVASGGGSDCFSVMVWDVKTRKLNYVLSGHEQPVCSVMFSSVAGGNHLVSGSWDQSMRVWQLSNGESKEVISTTSDVLAVAFRPDGIEIAGALLNGSIVFFDSMTGDQLKEIEGRYDLGLSKQEGELITLKKASEEKIFQTICYSSDGRFLLAAGNSKFVCLYSVEQRLLMARFQISCNMSLEGILEVHDRRKITEWGFSSVHIDLGDKKIMPGAKKDLNAKRQIKIEAVVSSIKFSPTGTNFAVASSEGVIIFSNDKKFKAIDFVGGSVDFSQFRADISPEKIRSDLLNKKFSLALNDSLRLKKIDILVEVIESIPIDEVQFIIKQLKIGEVGLALCRFLAQQLKNSVNVGFYSHWMKWVLAEWTQEIWSSSDLEWKTVTVDIIKSAKICKSKMIGLDLSSNKAAWIDAVINKQSHSVVKSI